MLVSENTDGVRRETVALVVSCALLALRIESLFALLYNTYQLDGSLDEPLAEWLLEVHQDLQRKVELILSDLEPPVIPF